MKKATPVKKWTVYLVQHTHTDIGYTKPQTEILSEHLRYIDYAIEYCEQTKDYTNDAKFRWTCESAWAVDEYLKNRPEEQVNKLKKIHCRRTNRSCFHVFQYVGDCRRKLFQDFPSACQRIQKTWNSPLRWPCRMTSTELHGVWQIICRTSG